MTSLPGKSYSLGLVFTEWEGQLDRLLLLLKKKPPTQAGKYNGIGGHFEPGETWEPCMIREAREEAELVTSSGDWTLVGTLYKPNKWVVYVCYTIIDENTLWTTVPVSCDEGEFLITDLNNLPRNMMPNIRWLVPLIRTHKKERQQNFHITYLADDED